MPTWVGIDIGAKAVSVAVVRATYRKTSLDALVSIDIKEGETALQDAIAWAVTSAIGGKMNMAESVGVAVEGSRIAVRLLSLPQSAQKQLADVLGFELEAQVPFDMASAVFDYRVLTGQLNEEGEMTVLTCVAREQDVRDRIDLVKSAIGIEPERVGAGPFPIANLAPYVSQIADAGPILVLDVGTRESELLIFRFGEPVFARTISCGTDGLPEVAEKISRELRLSLAAFRAQGGDTPVAAFVSGSGAFFDRVESYLTDQLQMPVTKLPIGNFDVTTLPAERIIDFARFAKATGLAVGLAGRAAGLNLRRGALAYERGFGWIREKIPLLAGLSAAIFVSFVFTSWARLHALSVEKDTLQTALGSVTGEVLGEETNDGDHAEELLQQQSALIDEDPMPHADAFDVMDQLSKAIPQSMKHDIEELDVQKNHVTVHGIVESRTDAEQIASTLRDERCFPDVNVTRSTQQVGGTAQKYAMEFDIKCPEDNKKAAKKKDATPTPSASASGPGGTSGSGDSK